jgi:hypothetical protein
MTNQVYAKPLSCKQGLRYKGYREDCYGTLVLTFGKLCDHCSNGDVLREKTPHRMLNTSTQVLPNLLTEGGFKGSTRLYESPPRSTTDPDS